MSSGVSHHGRDLLDRGTFLVELPKLGAQKVGPLLNILPLRLFGGGTAAGVDHVKLRLRGAGEA